jgi:hypothetical protein
MGAIPTQNVLYCAAGSGIAVLGDLLQLGAPLLAKSDLLKVGRDGHVPKQQTASVPTAQQLGTCGELLLVKRPARRM